MTSFAVGSHGRMRLVALRCSVRTCDRPQVPLAAGHGYEVNPSVTNLTVRNDKNVPGQVAGSSPGPRSWSPPV